MQGRWYRLVMALLIFLMLLPATPARPAPVAALEPVADVQPGLVASAANPADVLALAPDRSVFSALTPTQGRELWLTDGTPAGTTLLDLAPGVASSDPRALRAIDGEAWFWAYRDSSGPPALWRSDGTAAGTSVFDLAEQQSAQMVPGALAKADQRLFFVASDGAGAELWRSNGTLAGTQRVADLNPGGAGSAPAVLTAAGAWAYFTAFDGARWSLWRANRAGAPALIQPDVQVSAALAVGATLYATGRRANGTCGLWRVDASGAATLLAPVCADQLTAVNGRVVFVLDAATLWATSGGAPTQIYAAPAGDSIAKLAAGNAQVGLDSVLVMLHFDGLLSLNLATQAHSYLFDIQPFTPGFMQDMAVTDQEVYFALYLDSLYALGSYVYRFAGDQATRIGSFDTQHTIRLWSAPAALTLCASGPAATCDQLRWLSGSTLTPLQTPQAPAAAGLVPSDALLLANDALVLPSRMSAQVAGFPAAGTAGQWLGAAPQGVLDLGAQAVVPAATGFTGTDGSITSTLPLPATSAYAVISDTLYVNVLDPASPQYGEYWRTDGTAAGSQLVNAATTVGFSPLRSGQRALRFGPTLSVWDYPTGTPLFSTTTNLAADPASEVRADVAYAWSTDASSGVAALWRSDWTAAGTYGLWSAPSTAPAGRNDVLLLPELAPDTLHFVSGPLSAPELRLWSAPDTPGAATLLDSQALPVQPQALQAVSINPTTAAIVLTSAQHIELWSATADQLHPLLALTNTLLNPALAPLELDGRLIVPLRRPGISTDLWVTDGTAAGTHNLLPAAAADQQRNATLVRPLAAGLLFTTSGPDGALTLWAYSRASDTSTPLAVFAALTPITWLATAPAGELLAAGSALWRTDGTPAGTALVRAFAHLDSAVTAPFGADLLLAAEADATGLELWVTDGTTAGTTLVRDINPGPQGSTLAHLTALGDHAYFTASDGRHGSEPWITYGSAASTQMIADLWPGASGSAGLVAPRFQALGAAGALPPGWLEHAGRLWFQANDGLHGYEVLSIPLSATVALTVPATLTVGLDQATVPVLLTATGLGPASGPLTLTLTLPAEVAYADDTSGVIPASAGQTLTWAFSAPPLTPWELRLTLASGSPQTYALDWALTSSAGPMPATTLLQSRYQQFLPLLRR